MNHLIESSPNKSFFEFILTYQNKKAADLAFHSLAENSERPGSNMLRYWLQISGYPTPRLKNLAKLNLTKDISTELNELGILTDILISELKLYENAVQIAKYLEIFLNEASNYLENQKFEDKSKIENRIWNALASLRDWSLYLAIYFEDKKLYDNELQMRMIRCRMSTIYLNHAYHLVGPDMVGVAKNFEKLNQMDRALNFYRAVKTDFLVLFEKKNDNLLKSIEYKLALWALCESLKGISRLSKNTDNIENEKIISEIEKILK